MAVDSRRPHPPTRGSLLALLLALLVVDSLHFVFARSLLPYLEPAVSAFYVSAVASMEVGLFGLWRRDLHLEVLRRHLGFFLFIGALIGGSTCLNYTAVAWIDAGTASMFTRISLLFALLFGVMWLREQLIPSQYVGAALALVGATAITYVSGDYMRLGTLILLVSAAIYALHTAWVKRFGAEINFVDFLFYRMLCTCGFVLAVNLVLGSLRWPPLPAWPRLILTGSIDLVLSRALFYLALYRMQLSIHSIVLTLSPLAAVAWSWLLFREVPTLQQLLGGITVLLGVLLATYRRN